MPNQVQGNYRTTYDEEIQKRMDVPLCGDDVDHLVMGIALIPGDAQVLEDHPSLEKDDIRDTDNGSYELPSLITNDKVMLWAIPDGLDYGPLLVDYKNATDAMEKAFARHMGPGDEPLKEFADAMIFNPAKRVQEGWTSVKLINRLNPGAWYKEFGAYMNGGVSEEARKKFAWGDAHFPINRLAVSMDKIVGIHTDYFKKADNGTITAQEERDFRQALLEEEIRALHYLNQVATHTDPVEGARIKELSGTGNEAQQFNRYAARGIRMSFADTEARIAGLKAGWPIEDLNALSSYKYAMESIYNHANYDFTTTNPRILSKPEYRPGEQEYLGRMQRLWGKIESTPVRDNETRKALLTEMRELVREGVEKKFIDTKDLKDGEPEFSYALYDIDRKLARQLTPAETEVMLAGNGIDADRIDIVEQEVTDADRKRREEYEARQQREREEQELADALEALNRQEQEERELREILEKPDPNRYDEVVDDARRRRAEGLSVGETQARRMEVDPSGRIWFYDILEEKRYRAQKTTPVNVNNRPSSDQNNILRYHMAKKDLTFDQALDLQLLPPEDRREMAEEYYDDLIAHPFVGVPEEDAAKNARYLGELDAAGIKKILAEPLPYFNPAVPAQVKGYSQGAMGRLAAFTMDFGQNDKRLRDMKNPSSPVRQAYASAFGSREDYARIHGQAMIPNTLGEIAAIVNNEGFSPLQRAVALHFLQTKYDQIKGRPLSELPADQWIDLRATANGILESLPAFPTNGAPTDREIQLFLEGRAPSPFSEAYLKQFDARINAVRERVTAYGDDPAANSRINSIDMARVYQLDYISLREGGQPPLGPGGFAGLTPAQTAETRKIFEDTLGNYISTTDMQPTLAVMKGESVYDRFTVGGVKATEMMRNIYGDLYDFLTPEERETATEAELLKALADPTREVSFTPLVGAPDGTVIDRQPPVQIPHPAPQRVAENPVQPPDENARFEAQVSRAAQTAGKLNGILPGMFASFAPDYLEKSLPKAGSPEQVQQLKKDYLRGYAQAGYMLSGMMEENAQEGQGPIPGLSDYVKLQADRVRNAQEHPDRRENLPYTSLMGLVDQIHLPEADAVDHRQPGPVFRALADHPTGADPFPAVDAAMTAQSLMEHTAQYAERTKDTAHPVTPADDMQARRVILKDITKLEGQLDDLERIARTRRRGQQVAQAFDGENAVDRFVMGNPGLSAVRAELDGRRKALVQGWPVEDTDLIAGFYAKREVVNRALKTMPRGTDQYMAYVRAGRALDEICGILDNAVIDGPEKRSEIINTIDSYGPALYNDIVSRAGAPEAGQTALLKDSVRQAGNAQIPAAAFRSLDDNMAIGDEAYRLIQERDEAAKARAVQRQQLVANARRQAREEQLAIEQEEREWQEAYARGQAAYAREQEELRRIEEREDNKIGERLYREGLFDEPALEPAPEEDAGRQAEEEARRRAEERLAVEQEEREWQEAYARGQEQDRVHRERVNRQLAYRQNDANDFGYQSFDEAFASEADKAVSAFAPNDEYIQMLEEDGSFFGKLFEQKGQRAEAQFDLYGNGSTFGFFEWEDIRSRLNSFAKGPGHDLNIKTDRLFSVTNDMRAFLMARHGMSFEEVYALNAESLVERRKYAGEYLDELEAHPLNENMSAEEREASATYYGSMHKEAMDLLTDMTFPALDLSDREALHRIGNGPSMVHAANAFSVDLTQDSQSLFLGVDPAVRSAYVDALGGPASLARYHDQLSILQGASTLGMVASESANAYSPLRNKAYAKFELERLSETLRGKKLSEGQPGLGHQISERATQLLGVPLPADGAPTEEQLQAYLDGKIPSPFSQEYIARADAQMNTNIAASSDGSVRKDVTRVITEELAFKDAVYELPYIPVGPEAPRPRPDYITMSEKDRHDTHVTFDKIFGRFFNAQSNGQQRMSLMKGEEIQDRFRIDGKKVSEIPEIAGLKNVLTPEDFRILMESEILQAMADPKRTLTYVPLALNADGAVTEQAPITITKPAFAFDREEYHPDPAPEASAISQEIMKYTMGFGRIMADLTTVEGLREGDAFHPLRFSDSFDDQGILYETGDENLVDGEMGILKGKYPGAVHVGGDIVDYKLIHGLKPDGTLTGEGQRNFKKLKDTLNREYDQLMDLAEEQDAKNPMLADMIRVVADDVTTTDRGTPWTDLKQNYSYMSIISQSGTMHIGRPGREIPYDQIEVMRALQGYPAGEPVFPLPQAMSAVRRQTLATSALKRSEEAGTLSRMQERLTRRMMLAEMDQAEKSLRRINELDEKSHDLSSPEAMQVAHFNRFLDNDVNHASANYKRGTRYVSIDMAGKRALLANGWPVKDLDMLSFLYVRRGEIKEIADNPGNKDEVRESARRGYQVLNEICEYLDHTEIRSAEDRTKALEHIRSYGDLFFNDRIHPSPASRYFYEKQLDGMIRRPVREYEFLSDAERQEYRESYEAFRSQDGSYQLTPTVNGPQTDIERAFLDPENISLLAEAQGQMETDPELMKDPVLTQARHQTEHFLAEVDQFYRRKELSEPAHAEERQQRFEKLLTDSTGVVDALAEAEDKLTNGGKKTSYTPAQEKMLKEIRLARRGMDGMRRRYVAQMAYEDQRRADLQELRENTARYTAEQEVLREYDDNYMVDLDYALMNLSEEEQERLIRLLTEPKPETERFDFETGEVIPARERELPERIRMDYDDEGNLKPQILILADRQEREAREEAEREARVAEEARRNALRAERAAGRERVPYEEGAADLFEAGDAAYEAENREAERIRERIARADDAERRRERADETGEERYAWSFAHILRDANDQRKAADQALEDVQRDPATTDARLVEAFDRASEAAYVSDEMEKAVVYSYDAETLDREIERRWPEIYQNSYRSKIADWVSTGANESAATSMSARLKTLQSLPEKERYEILGRLAESLSPAQREELRNRLINTRAPLSIPYEEQVTEPLHERIAELKKQEIPANREGVPLVPERIREYREALAYADRVLEEAGEEQRRYGTITAVEREREVNKLRQKQTDRVIAGKNDSFRLLAAGLKNNRTQLLEEGILPSQEEALREIVDGKEEHAPEYIRALGRLMTRMEEMGIDPGAGSEEQQKNYAFANLAKANQELKQAIQDGDPERIIEAARSRERWSSNMRELVSFTRENFSPDTAPGNMDTRRNPAVPWGFSDDYTATSQINGAFQLYSALKRTGVTVQEFVEDPDAAMRRMFAKLDEKNSYREQFKDKSIGSALGAMMAEDADHESRRIIRSAGEDQMVLRGGEMLTESDPDAGRRAQNRATRSLKMAHRNLLTRTREIKRNPFLQKDDNKRRREVLQLLNVVNEEDLKADYDRMVCGMHFDAQGRKVAPVTAEQYIANKQNINYTKLADRGADIIRDALAVPGSTFDAAEFMRERQRVLSSLLLTKAADAGKPGFDRLEYELTHMEETYDMLRVHNPQMPALTQQQRQSFRAQAAQYAEKRKKLHSDMTREQRNVISRRRRRAGDIGRRARADLLNHELHRSQLDAVRRNQEETRRRQAEALRQQQEQQRLAVERIRQQEDKAREELRAELRRQKEAPALERRRMANDSLTLTGQFRSVYGLAVEAAQTKRTVQRRNPVDPVELRDAILAERDTEERCDQMLGQMIRAYQGDPGVTRISADQMRELLKGVVDDRRAQEILDKIPRGIGFMSDLNSLSVEERSIVVGAVAGAIDERERERILAEDDAFVPISKQDLTGSPFMPGQDPERQSEINRSYEKHMANESPKLREIRNLKAEIQNNSARFAKTRKERQALMADLNYAERMMRPSREGARHSLQLTTKTRDDCSGALRDRMISEDLNRQENRYMGELTERDTSVRFRIFRPRADKSADIRKLKDEKLIFSPEYTKTVAGMLRKMEQMQILDANAAGEEGTKVYGFNQLVKAQNALMEAIRSKDRERIGQSTARLKEVRQGMDELMQTARDNFHPSDYVPNLDVIRNEEIPWDYARDVVPSSQLNSIYLFGSALKKNGISIDEFERDPGAALQKLEKLGAEKGNSMKGLCEGKSAGVLAAQAATGILPYSIEVSGITVNAAYMRGVGGLVAADPGISPETRRRNDLIYQKTHDFNSAVNSYRVESSKLLKNGFMQRSERGRDALRTLMMVDMKEADADRMFADPPITPEGFRAEPLTLADYIVSKKNFDYAAQVGRIEEILADAAAETARLAALRDEADGKNQMPMALAQFSRKGFDPYQMLKARQEALTQLLVMRSKDKEQPGFRALEEELRSMPEKYEALRKTRPDLKLPELTAEQRLALQSGARAYDDLTVNRNKTLEAEEKRIVKAEADREKTFLRTLKDLNKIVKSRQERLDKLMQQGASAEQIGAAEEAYANAYQQRDTLIKGRAQTILDGYKEGNLPETYAAARLRQLMEMSANNHEPVQAPPVFGAPERIAERERVRQEYRERFLTQGLLLKQGIRTAGPITQPADSMLDSVEMLGLVQIQDNQPQAQQQNVAPQVPVPPQVPNGQPQVPNGQPPVPVPPQVPVQPQAPNGQPPQQKAKDDGPIRDKSIEELEKKILGEKLPQPEHRQRRNSVSGPGARQQMDGQIGPQQGPRQGN